MEELKKDLQESISIIDVFLNNPANLNTIKEIVAFTRKCFIEGNKVIFCGNGGSAAQAQHLAAELSGKFKIDRKPLPSEACHVNASFLTAVSNDYDFTKSYERYIEAFGKKGDILIGLSTSGNSKNIINAFLKAKKIGFQTFAFTGKSGGNLIELADKIIRIPSENVARIQEMHLLIGHIICEKVEKELFENGR